MAAYQTQQINVGSIAAPDVGSVFANFADRINKQQSNQLDNMRQAAQYDRQQVLNQRADQDWNRQQGIYKAKADVAADFAANQFADKYTGQNKVNNDAVVNAYVKYVENGGEMTDDLNKRVQALTEQNRGFQEDATPAIAQELVKRSNGAISMTDAMNEAKGIAMGLPSRVAQQELADKETKRQQEYQDLIAKNNLDKFKLQAEIAKDNQEGRYKDAELKFKQFQAMYGGGTGGSGGGAHGPVSYMDTTAFLDSTGLSPYGTGWVPGSDKSDAYAAMNANKADNVPAPVTLQALKNSILTDERGSTFDMAKFKAETDRLKGTYVDPKTVSTFKEIQAPTDEQWQSTVPKYVDRTIIGATPNTAEARARLVVPELFRGDPTKISEVTKTSNPPTNVVAGASGNTLADRNNNPGNLRVSSRNDWQGGQEGEKGFVKFDTPELGARALAKTINNNVGMTVKGFINKYAPPSENDTGSYIDQVSKRLGKDSSSTISKDDIPELMKVIAKREGGSFTNDQLMGGYKLFLNETTKGDTSKLPEVTNVDKAYDRLSSTIEPMLPKDTKIETQEQKQALLDNYTNSSTVPNEVLQSAKKDYLESGGGTLDDIRIKSNLARDGKLSDKEAENVYEQLKNSVASDNNIAYRNYLIAKRTGSYQGKSADDWYDELDSKSKSAVWAPAASVIAALPPAAMLFGGSAVTSTLPTVTATGARTLSGGSKANILNDMFVPQIQRLMSQPYTAEVKEGLLNAVSKLPQAEKIQVIKYIQRMEQLGK